MDPNPDNRQTPPQTLPSSNNSASTRIFHLNFLQVANQLKIEWRKSWPQGYEAPSGSVAADSWRMTLMLLLYHDKLDRVIDLSKCLQMAIIHDLPEALVGDLPLTKQRSEEIKSEKKLRKIEAMHSILEMLGEAEDPSKQSYFQALYDEYEAQESYEAKVVKAIDKLEAFQQQNEDPLETWLPEQQEDMLFQDQCLMEHCTFDSFLTHLANEIIENGVKKLESNGVDVGEIRKSSALSLPSMSKI